MFDFSYHNLKASYRLNAEEKLIKIEKLIAAIKKKKKCPTIYYHLMSLSYKLANK